MIEDFLRDDYCQTGTDVHSFYNLLEEIEAHTKVKRVLAEDIVPISIDMISYNDIEGAESFLAKRYNYSGLGLIDSDSEDIDCEKVCGKLSFLYEEVANKSKLCLSLNGKILPTSMLMLSSLGIRLGMGSSIQKPSTERDAFICRLLGEMEKKPLTVISHEVENVEKVFAILSNQYTYIPQTIIKNMILDIEKDGKMGKAECMNWYIDQMYTQVNLAFPEYADEIAKTYGKLHTKLIPGLQIISSDMAESSLIIRGVWYKKGTRGFLIQNEIRKKHTGQIDMIKIREQIQKEIFDEFRNFPEQLCHLMKITITNPIKSSKENRIVLEKCIKDTFKDIDVTSAVGKKNETILKNTLLDELDETIPYTAYDIAMIIMELPDRLVNPERGMYNRLAKACKKAIYRDYGKEDGLLSLSA